MAYAGTGDGEIGTDHLGPGYAAFDGSHQGRGRRLRPGPVTMNVEQIPTLDEAELAILGPLGTRRNIEVGEYLFREGDTTYDFYVVLSGLVEITVRADGEDRVIITHGAGRFLGELNLLTGSRVFLSARVAEPGEVLAVPLEAFRRVIAIQPLLSDKILVAFMARRAELLRGAAVATRVISETPECNR